ncbi:xylose isomerase [Coxiella burnetii]|uniref:xylose isomerase n=2 Tax=Coxiella burnetii TaxID=777 RepID=UPI0000ED004E|nr:xylose isomerase [Coxiella burnetii]ACJ19819.1 xylose isomerase [Coxiella burnetii CbuK_Q154]AIT62837.1 Xylose isomerase [Coxiella burnetii str. Namibia]ATN85523.1 xylose isomerase [Coxiella burnetii str. Schperling]EAX33351.1 xylose isomerase [Coxiella burnetii 'MSU Goat Q177']EDR36202.1 xylose isomerase [Coxiella burnetii Q321]
MKTYFKPIDKINYEGPDSENPLSFHYYDPQRIVLGKSMEEHLRMAVCFWHTFCWEGNDNFGAGVFNREWLKEKKPMKRAKQRVLAAFEFFEKLGLPFFTFHDRDVSPEGDSLKETIKNFKKIAELIAKEMERTGVQLLWGTANLFSHPRYLAGAATNPDPNVFAHAVAQVKTALDITQQLNGKNYVLWGGREGYETLLNTDLKQELDQFGRFLSLLVDYKHKIGFNGLLLIEPKPCEPTKHQYDFDVATVYAFLQRYGLEKEFKVNIEANHATLAGHSFAHEIAYACANDIFGSVDANRGDPQLGWDTDQFPIDLQETVLVLYLILKHGGFTSGGFNFDAKLRRQSLDLEDLFYAHISGIDTLARGLLIAATIIENDKLKTTKEKRYQAWKEPLNANMLSGKLDFETIAKRALDNNLDPKPTSGEQEKLERWLSER